MTSHHNIAYVLSKFSSPPLSLPALSFSLAFLSPSRHALVTILIHFPNMPKRIVLCLDGTWDSADEGSPSIPSNVARLSRMIASEGKTKEGFPVEQVVYYQSGVGTGAMNRLDKIYQGPPTSPNFFSHSRLTSLSRDHRGRRPQPPPLRLPLHRNKLLPRRRNIPFRILAWGIHSSRVRLVSHETRGAEARGFRFIPRVVQVL
jgi:Uncharacterized alpha/beta hydrolase domain (DUF2235)